MAAKIVSENKPVLLIGGGDVDKVTFDRALTLGQTIVAADGGADTVLRFGHTPRAVIGDMDSISEHARTLLDPATLFPIAEQDSTDFDKGLRSIQAPMVVGLGFLGRRVDHTLAVLSVLARRSDRRVLLLGGHDAVATLPPELALDLPVGTRLSLFPMAPVSGRSEGLHWPIDGLTLAPGGTIGTSNRTSAPRVRLWAHQPGLLVMLPVSRAPELAAALHAAAAQWPAHAEG